MLDAQLVILGNDYETGQKLYSPWFPRGGDSARFTAELAQVYGATLKIEVFTKNSEDAGDGANADSAGVPTNITLAAVGRTTTEWYSSGTIGLKELVRYRYEVTGTIPGNWVLFRMLAPVWFDAVKA